MSLRSRLVIVKESFSMPTKGLDFSCTWARICFQVGVASKTVHVVKFRMRGRIYFTLNKAMMSNWCQSKENVSIEVQSFANFSRLLMPRTFNWNILKSLLEQRKCCSRRRRVKRWSGLLLLLEEPMEQFASVCFFMINDRYQKVSFVIFIWWNCTLIQLPKIFMLLFSELKYWNKTDEYCPSRLENFSKSVRSAEALWCLQQTIFYCLFDVF